jgi:hypothetical protein
MQFSFRFGFSPYCGTVEEKENNMATFGQVFQEKSYCHEPPIKGCFRMSLLFDKFQDGKKKHLVATRKAPWR